jgi:hypothetical protein
MNQLSADRAAGERLSPYTITLGDEVQCLYAQPTSAVLDMIEFQARIWPFKMRFCLGLGDITTPINREAAIGMDGPAFYAARAGIDQLKDSPSALAIRAQAGIDVGLEDATVRLIDAAMTGWRGYRFQILVGVLAGHDAKRIAADLQLSSTAIYKNLAVGRIPLIMEAAQAVGRSLETALRATRRAAR